MCLSILLIRGFLFVFVIYLNSNTSIIFIKKKKYIQNTKLLLPKNIKSNTISCTKGKKENRYSQHPFVFKYLIHICICYLFVFKYFNYLYKNKYKITSIKKTKTKKPLPHVKTTHSSKIFMVLFLIL